jgi:hypothetical protein
VAGVYHRATVVIRQAARGFSIAAIALCAFAAPAAAQKLPNLRVVEVRHPKSNASPGDQLAITDKVKNAGGKSAGPSVVRFYLSADVERDRSDTRLVGSQSTGRIAPGVKFVGEGHFGIPPSTPAGDYFLIACADDTKKVRESSEDNCRDAGKKLAVEASEPAPVTPYEVNDRSVKPGTEVELSGVEVTARGPGGLFWVDVPASSSDYAGAGNSGLEAAIRFSPPPALTPGDRVTLTATTAARSFEAPSLNVSSLSKTGSGPVNPPVTLSAANFANPPAGLNGVLVAAQNVTKTAESMDHHQWVMSDGTYGFGITDIAIGTLPSEPNGTSFARIVGLADTTTNQVVIFPRTDADFTTN